MTPHTRPVDSVAWVVWLLAVAWTLIPVRSLLADELSQGQKVYVPIYSHIYSGDKENPFLLTAILSVRNTDPGHAITLNAVDYFDSDGKLLRRYLKKPEELGALASIRYVVGESDKSGGSGAKFVVEWRAASKVNPPIIEGVMIGTKMQQGISFVSRGQVLYDTAAKP
ncbi:MAG: DUF3124 domain-containing protein [Desulfobacterales bacterium]